MIFFSRLAFILGFVFFITLNIFGDNTPPNWLRQASSASVPGYEKDVPGVVLHDEEQVTLDNSGNLVTVQNYAVKVLTREGRNLAIARALYLVSSGKIREISGWLIRADGTTKEYNKKTVLDVISDPDDIYNEYRIKVIDASGDVDVGSVFGYTVVSEDKPLFYQDIWQTQGRLPTILSRYSLNLPAGWKASSITFNHAEITPQVNGTNYIWEIRNLPPIPPELLSPSVKNLAPHVAINYTPADSAQAVNRSFANWTEVSRWASALYDPQVIVDDAVAAKAQELTVNAKTEYDKIRAIGTYVQNLQYISIDIGVGYGNGYRPRSSSLVLNRGYGDCKDKANLMRAMLKALKIEAYPIAIFSGDPTFVREEWVSPSQFNHCIIAIKINDATTAPTVITHAKLGRLLIFDATDDYTPVGDLPDHEQGSLALIIAGENGGLARMPVTPPEFNLWDRQVEVDLTAEGNIKGVIRERATGQQSKYARALFRSLSASDFNKAIEGWLTRGATAAKLHKVTPKDQHLEASFDLDVEFSAPYYGQLMQNRLLVFKPAIVSRSNSIYLTEPKRNSPIELDSDSFDERAVFTLPQGFIVDEMPDALNLETPFGKYKTSYEVKDGKLIFTRSMVLNRTQVAVDKYKSVRDFYSQILAAEQSPVVLMRK